MINQMFMDPTEKYRYIEGNYKLLVLESKSKIILQKPTLNKALSPHATSQVGCQQL